MKTFLSLSRLALALGAAICLSSQSRATSILIGDVYKASLTDVNSEVHYVNTLLDVAAGDLGLNGIYGETYGSKIRTYSVLNLGFYGSGEVSSSDTSSGSSSVSLSGWDFLVANYNSRQFVWFLGGGSFDIPITAVDLGWAAGLSSWQTFTAHAPNADLRLTNPLNVPEGGSTGMLFAVGLTGLFSLRRVLAPAKVTG
jgi:hypothetical protein